MLQKKYILQILSLLVVGLLSLKLSTDVFNNNLNIDIGDVLQYIIPIFVLYLINELYFKVDIVIFNKNWFYNIFTKGYYIFIASIIFFSLSISEFNKSITINLIGIYAISCLCTGIFEELLLRGLIQNIIQNNLKNPLKSIIIASLIFALIHFVNLISRPYLIIGTISQVGYTFFIGFLLGVIYYVSNSLACVICLHAIFNFLSSFVVLYTDMNLPKNNVDINILSLIIQWSVMLPCLFFGMLIYKKNNGNK